MDPQQWIAEYEKRITDVATRAKNASASLRKVGGSAISPRGEVEVKVNAGGVLEDLTLTPEARALESHELARLILDTTRQARTDVSTQIAGISTKYFGEGPHLDVIKQHLPAGVTMAKNPDDDDYFANPPEITQ